MLAQGVNHPMTRQQLLARGAAVGSGILLPTLVEARLDPRFGYFPDVQQNTYSSPEIKSFGQGIDSPWVWSGIDKWGNDGGGQAKYSLDSDNLYLGWSWYGANFESGSRSGFVIPRNGYSLGKGIYTVYKQGQYEVRVVVDEGPDPLYAQYTQDGGNTWNGVHVARDGTYTYQGPFGPITLIRFRVNLKQPGKPEVGWYVYINQAAWNIWMGGSHPQHDVSLLVGHDISLCQWWSFAVLGCTMVAGTIMFLTGPPGWAVLTAAAFFGAAGGFTYIHIEHCEK